MPTYTVTGPDGTTIDITGDKPPSPDIVQAAFAHAGKKSPVSGLDMASGRVGRDTGSWDGPAKFDRGQDIAAMGAGMAHPQGVGDFLSLLVPSELPNAGEFISRSAGALKTAAHDTPGSLKGMLSYPARAFSKFRESLPSSMDQAVADFHGGAAPPVARPSPSISTPAPDAWDRMLAEARQTRKPGTPPVLRKAADAPTLSGALKDALEAAREDIPGAGTTPPAPTITSAGREGAFQSSGRPSVTAQRYDEIASAPAQARTQNAPLHTIDATAPAAGRATKAATPAVGTKTAASAATAPSTAGGQPSMEEAVGDKIRDLRRKYGAGRLGKAVSPEAPEAGNGFISRADSSRAPSAMPDIAQEAVLRDLKANTSADPAKVIRAVRQLVAEYGRNKGPANSTVARELHDLLKGAGFVKD